MSYFNSTAFVFLEDVIYKEPLKWFPLLIFCSLLFFNVWIENNSSLIVGGGHIKTDFSEKIIKRYFYLKGGAKYWFLVKTSLQNSDHFAAPIYLQIKSKKNQQFIMNDREYLAVSRFYMRNWNSQRKVLVLKPNTPQTIIFSGSNCASEVCFSLQMLLLGYNLVQDYVV